MDDGQIDKKQTNTNFYGQIHHHVHDRCCHKSILNQWLMDRQKDRLTEKQTNTNLSGQIHHHVHDRGGHE